MGLIGTYNKSTTRKFESPKVLKKISLIRFFYQPYFIFVRTTLILSFGKPLVELTFYQVELFGYARYYKSLMESSESKVPDEVRQDPEKIVEWFEFHKKRQRSAMDKVANTQDKTVQCNILGRGYKRRLKTFGIGQSK